MTCSRTLIKFLAVIIFALSVHSVSFAQERYWVSGTGNDANPCFRLSPCRTFQRAHDVAIAGHEIVALDSAGYGPIIITKSVSISGEGHYAGITVFAGITGILIGSPTAVVVLRNLYLDGLNGVGHQGIRVSNAASLHIENCVIQGFNSLGLLVDTTANPAIKVTVKDTVMRNSFGNQIAAGKAVFENCRFEKNTVGVTVSNAATATFHDCVMAGNSNQGLFVFDTNSRAMVDQCQLSNNGTGIFSSENGQVRVSHSNITENIAGLATATGGTLLTLTTAAGAFTNTIEDNAANGAFTGTYLAK